MDLETKVEQKIAELQTRIEQQVKGQWRNKLTDRERRLILNCETYAANDPAGLPGHNLMLLVATMARWLDENS